VTAIPVGFAQNNNFVRHKYFYLFFVIAVGFGFFLAQHSYWSGPVYSAGTLYTVRGNSLSGIIDNGEEIIIYWGYYDKYPIERGDVVAYQHAGNKAPIIKKVYATPGDDFAIVDDDDGQYRLLINGELARTSLGEPYRFNEKRGGLLAQYEKDYGGVVPDGAVIILGNLSNGTMDSSMFGLASMKNILGKAVTY